jgi:NAD(P)-dependent dehydrogenase (short-subunit alcohol dehydrogenase family)
MSLTSPLRLYILTGASRGLGAAMADQLLAPDVHLVTMSRRPDKALDAKAAAARAGLEQWAVDLAQPVAVAARLEAWLEQRDGAFSSATLINNAAITGRPGPIDTSDAEDLSALLRIGLEAPMLLSSAFLRATRAWKAPRRILNISSGAGRSPLAGAAGYCAAKAGLDHLSRVTAIDESGHDNGAKIVSLAPGVIDTDMQTEMRSSDPSRFPEVQRFIDMKTSGQLASPQQAAARVLAWLDRSDFGNKPVADVRDA